MKANGWAQEAYQFENGWNARPSNRAKVCGMPANTVKVATENTAEGIEVPVHVR